MWFVDILHILTVKVYFILDDLQLQNILVIGKIQKLTMELVNKQELNVEVWDGVVVVVQTKIKTIL